MRTRAKKVVSQTHPFLYQTPNGQLAECVLSNDFSKAEFASIPYYSVVQCIFKPTLLMSPNYTSFERVMCGHSSMLRITKDVLNSLHENSSMRILARYAIVNVNEYAMTKDVSKMKEMQESLPVYLFLKINKVSVKLHDVMPSNKPSNDGCRHPKPIDITKYVLDQCPQTIKYRNLIVENSWVSMPRKFAYFVFAVFLCHKPNYATLIESVRKIRYIPRADTINKLCGKNESIKSANVKGVTSSQDNAVVAGFSNTLDDSNDAIEMLGGIPLSLVCPISGKRIVHPVLGQNCRHHNCFDLNSFLLMNEQKPTWKCPICKTVARYEQVYHSEYIQEILLDPKTQDCTQVLIDSDGNWSPNLVSNHRPAQKQLKRKRTPSIVTPKHDGQGFSSSVFIDLCEGSNHDSGASVSAPIRPYRNAVCVPLVRTPSFTSPVVLTTQSSVVSNLIQPELPAKTENLRSYILQWLYNSMGDELYTAASTDTGFGSSQMTANPVVNAPRISLSSNCDIESSSTTECYGSPPKKSAPKKLANLEPFDVIILSSDSEV